MTPLEETLWMVAAVVGLGGSAVCSGMETGLYALNRGRLAIHAGAANPPRWARRLKAQADAPAPALATLLVGTNAFNYLGVLSVTELLAGAGLSDRVIMALNALIVTPMLLVFAESLPKEIFRKSADRLMPRFAALLWTMRWLATISGVLPLTMLIVRSVSRFLGVPPEPTLSPREQIGALLAESTAAGSLSRAQGELIERAMQLGRARVGREMVPWPRVHTLRLSASRRELLESASRKAHARYPVVDRARSVVGVVELTELLLRPSTPIDELLIEPIRLSAALSVTDAIDRLRHAQSGLALVEDARGLAGVVTLKDLVEPLVGELASW